MNEAIYKHLFSIISIAIILLIPIAISDRILSNSYGQALEKTYTNQNCGISIQYPSDWKIDENLMEYKPGDVINYIDDFELALTLTQIKARDLHLTKCKC